MSYRKVYLTWNEITQQVGIHPKQGESRYYTPSLANLHRLGAIMTSEGWETVSEDPEGGVYERPSKGDHS